MLTLTPHEFVDKWKQVTARERQIYQEHFLDLCYLLGHPTPNSFDPTGKRFGFEMGAAKTSGGQGWADVAKLEYFGWEYKARPEDLSKAYAQLLLYRDALQNPPVLVVSDIRNIIIRTNFTNLPTLTHKLTLEDLLDPEKLKILKAVFFHPETLKPQITVEGVTREAAMQFSRLAENLRRYGNDSQDIAHFLIRCQARKEMSAKTRLKKSLFPQWESPLAFVKVELHCWSTAQANSFGQAVS